MRRSIKLAAIALALVGCQTPQVKEIETVSVALPVAQPCSAPSFEVIERPELPIKDITAQSQMDRDVDLWKATVMRLLGYIVNLESGIAARDKVLAVCRGQ